MSQPSTGNWIRLFLLGLLWGGSFMAVTLALEGFGPFTITAIRVALAALILQAIARQSGARMPRLRQKDGVTVWLCVVGVSITANALPFVLLSWAQRSVASGFAGVSMAAVPLIVLPLAHFFVPGERLNLRRLAGFLMGAVGAIVLIGPEAFNTTGADLETLARFACLAAAACYAMGSIITRLCPDVSFFAFGAAVMTFGSVLLLPLAFLIEGLPARPGMTALLAVLYLGILPTALAQILLIKVIREAGPTFMSLVNYQVPLWSAAFGALLLQEALPPQLFLALALILLGLVVSQWTGLRQIFARRGA